MERGLSSAFTRSKGQQLEGRFVQAMADVDEKIQNVPFSKLKSDREEISSRDVLTKFLQRHRKKVKYIPEFSDTLIYSSRPLVVFDGVFF